MRFGSPRITFSLSPPRPPFVNLSFDVIRARADNEAGIVDNLLLARLPAKALSLRRRGKTFHSATKDERDEIIRLFMS
jgi:hypothetical protein